MLPASYADIELLESEELPLRTLVAPPILARELRLALDAMDLTIQTGSREAVLISSDLYEAFQQWDGGDESSSSLDGQWN